MANWNRNLGRTVYHKDAQDWVVTGKALCGADIGRPAYVAQDIEEIRRNGGKPVCKRCLKALTRGR